MGVSLLPPGRIGLRTINVASMILLTVVVPIRKAKLRDFWLSPDVKNQRLNAERSAAGIDFLKRVSRV